MLILLAYAVSVNGSIHTQQLILLNKLTRNDKKIHEKVYNILLSDETYQKNDINYLKDIMMNISTKERNWLKRMMLKLMCYDGSFDEVEQIFMEMLFPEIKYNKFVISHYIRNFKFHTISFPVLSFIKKIIGVEKTYSVEYELMTEHLFEQNYEIISRSISRLGLFSDFSHLFEKYIEDVSHLSKDEITLALAGKTKSGKSTLMSLISGTGQELIGKKGTQRTSKCNIITHYKGIKIIDTPGLAAASKKGDLDEQKAIDSFVEADMILFIIPNDTYDEELKFIDKLVQMNKPISILVNYKNSSWFKYKIEDILSKPDIWKNESSENNLCDWSNQLVRFAKAGHYFHVIENKIYYAFLYEATNDWMNNCGKKISHKKLKEIHDASGFSSSMSKIFQELTEKSKLFRLIKIFEVHLNFIKHISSEIEIKLSRNNQKFEEIKNILESISYWVEKFKNNCQIHVEEKIKEIFFDMLFSSRELEENVFKLNNSEFESYINNLFEKTNNLMFSSICSVVSGEVKETKDKLSLFGIEYYILEPPCSKFQIYQINETFKISEKFNLFKVKETYIISQTLFNAVGLFLSPIFSIPLTKGTEIVSDRVKAKSLAELKNNKAKNRMKEVIAYFSKLEIYYTYEVKNYINDHVQRIAQAQGNENYKSQSIILQKNNEELNMAISEINHAKDITIQQFAISFLKERQKSAHYVRYSLSFEYNMSVQVLYIYARNCTEEKFDDTMQVIWIKEVN